MTNYSIIKVGNHYIVQADDQCILKVASRRRAVQLISDAADLLKAEAEKSNETAREPSRHGEVPKAS
jgi:hypothetical protein